MLKLVARLPVILDILLVTNAVVAICVLFVLLLAVGAVGVPDKFGEVIVAYLFPNKTPFS